jgi:hypothetical protein
MIEKESLPDFTSGTISVDKTPVQMSSVVHTLKKGVYIHVGASPAAALVSIGQTAAEAAAGFVTPAGATSPMLYIDDLSKFWIVSTENGTTVSWIAF